MKTLPFTKTYPDGFTLRAGEFELTPGRICCVLGANGCGKSTLGRCLAGTLKTDGNSSPWTEKITVGYLPQKPYPFKMSMENNILLAEKDREKAVRLMAHLQIAHLTGHRGDRLSGGESARMCLARILMKTFSLLILDEPSASMDIEAIQLAERAVRDYRDETGAAVLFITHDIRQAERISDEMMFLDKGRILEHTESGMFFRSPQSVEGKRFLEFYGGLT